MDTRRSLGVLRRWAWLLIAAVLLAGGAAFLVSSALPKTYEASVTLMVGQSLQATSPDYNGLLASARLSQTYANLVDTEPLLAKVIDREQLNMTTDQLGKAVKADAPSDSSMLTITVDDPDPARVAAIANTIADELIAESPAVNGRNSTVQSFVDSDLASVQQQIEDAQTEAQRLSALQAPAAADQARLQTLQAQLVSLHNTYSTLLQFSSTRGTSLLTVVNPAVQPTAPSSPRVLLNTALAAMVGLLLAVGAAFLIEYLDDTLKSADDVEAAVDLPTLGAIIRMKGDDKRAPMYRLAAILYPRSPAAEGYRTLRTNIEFASLDAPVRTILVTSAIPGEGKTTTAANLAAVFAQAGQSAILVDCDLRKPGVHQIFGLQNSVGLSTLLRNEGMAVDEVAQATEQEHLRVVTTGQLPPNPAELIRSGRMRATLALLAASADFVVVDSPPLQAVTDAAILSSLVDGTVLVVDAGRTRSGAVRSGREALAKVGARVLGVTLNRLTESMSGDYYYYDYYGGYGADGKDQDGKTGRGEAAPAAKAERA